MVAVLAAFHHHPHLHLVDRRHLVPRRLSLVASVTRPAPVVVYRRRRLVAAVVLVAFLWLAIGLVVQVSVAVADVVGPAPSEQVVAQPAAEVGPSTYTVRSGDTLWSIAERLDAAADPRPLVDELAERTGGAALRTGQRVDIRGLG